MRNDGVERSDGLAAVEQLGVAFAHADVELERVQHLHLMAAVPSGLDQDARAVQGFVPRQDGQTHNNLQWPGVRD